MNKVNKGFLSFIIMLSVFVGGTTLHQQNVYAAEVTIGEGKTVQDVFPNEKLAKKIATQLGKQVEDSITQDELDGVSSFVTVTGGNGITSIEGVQYLRNLSNLLIYGTDIETLPEEMAQLTKLKSLQLNANKLTEVPAWIGQLTNLEKLTFFQNEITSFSADLSGMSKLKEFTIYDNKLTSMDTTFPNSLEILEINGNELTEVTDNFIVPNLKKLALHDNKLQSLNLRLDELVNLTELSIHTNEIESRVPQIALKPGQIDKFYLTNHTQVAINENMSVYSGDTIHGNDLLNDLLLQVKEDRELTGGKLSDYGKWAVREKGSYATNYITYVDGSEINNQLFEVGKSYEIEFISTSNSMREWGYSTFRTTVYFSEKEQSTIRLNMVDEEGETIIDEAIVGFVGDTFRKEIASSFEKDGTTYEFVSVSGANVDEATRSTMITIVGSHASRTQDITLSYKKVNTSTTDGNINSSTVKPNMTPLTKQSTVSTGDTTESLPFVLLGLVSLVVLARRYKRKVIEI